MATLHLIHGFIGAGKTTYARELEAKIGAFRITHDEWMAHLYGIDPPAEHFKDYASRIADMAWMMAARLHELGQDVILDFGFCSRADRDDARRRASAFGADVKLYTVTCAVPEMRRRAIARNDNLDEAAMFIAPNTFDIRLPLFEPVAGDEPHIEIKTD